MRKAKCYGAGLLVSTILLGSSTDAVPKERWNPVDIAELASQETSDPDSSEELDAIFERFHERQIIRGSRLWSCRKDMNGDGKFTVSDIPLLIQCVFFYPGDSLIYNLLLEKSNKATFFELTPESYGGKFSFVASFVVWVAALLVAILGIIAYLLMEMQISTWWENRKQGRKGTN